MTGCPLGGHVHQVTVMQQRYFAAITFRPAQLIFALITFYNLTHPKTIGERTHEKFI